LGLLLLTVHSAIRIPGFSMLLSIVLVPPSSELLEGGKGVLEGGRLGKIDISSLTLATMAGLGLTHSCSSIRLASFLKSKS
jgi:hypothetical protein